MAFDYLVAVALAVAVTVTVVVDPIVKRVLKQSTGHFSASTATRIAACFSFFLSFGKMQLAAALLAFGFEQFGRQASRWHVDGKEG